MLLRRDVTTDYRLLDGARCVRQSDELITLRRRGEQLRRDTTPWPCHHALPCPALPCATLPCHANMRKIRQSESARRRRRRFSARNLFSIQRLSFGPLEYFGLHAFAQTNEKKTPRQRLIIGTKLFSFSSASSAPISAAGSSSLSTCVRQSGSQCPRVVVGIRAQTRARARAPQNLRQRQPTSVMSTPHKSLAICMQGTPLELQRPFPLKRKSASKGSKGGGGKHGRFALPTCICCLPACSSTTRLPRGRRKQKGRCRRRHSPLDAGPLTQAHAHATAAVAR
ncbi:hypothetical protein BS50DRAFT_223643 [Corynespora cassiicola Philippines]|uniref:Uncharacterized protein n=1 Tax=Corynespora cassiicola Philippines TaxID=1448308 RepID=A0A2T2N3Y7_CORCC|nr:hypothetical protein BS50DRAFT_223643 [Corynespora cassiicola Philippines]